MLLVVSTLLSLLLGLSSAQNGDTCCASSYKKVTVRPSQNKTTEFYYNGDTGSSLEIKKEDGLVERKVFQNASDNIYYSWRRNGICQYFQGFVSKECISENWIFENSQVVDGQTLYAWRKSANSQNQIFYDENCIEIDTEPSAGVSLTYTANADVSVIDTFNSTSCVEFSKNDD